MQKLTDSHGVPVIQRALRFLGVRLRSRPQTADLAAEVAQQRQALGQADDAWQQASEERIAASAELTYRDRGVNEAVLGLSRELSVLTAGRRDDPRHRRLFAVAPSEGVRGVATPEQDRFVATLIATLRQDSELGPLKGHAEGLEAQQKAVEEARRTRDALYVPEAQALAARRQAMDQARRVYNLFHPRLTLMFPDDPALVESFFAKLVVRGGTETGAEATEEGGEEA